MRSFCDIKIKTSEIQNIKILDCKTKIEDNQIQLNIIINKDTPPITNNKKSYFHENFHIPLLWTATIIMWIIILKYKYKI